MTKNFCINAFKAILFIKFSSIPVFIDLTGTLKSFRILSLLNALYWYGGKQFLWETAGYCILICAFHLLFGWIHIYQCRNSPTIY